METTYIGENIVYHTYEKVLGYDDPYPPIANDIDIYTYVVIDVSSGLKPQA